MNNSTLKLEFEKPCKPSVVLEAFEAIKDSFSQSFRLQFKGHTNKGKKFSFSIQSNKAMDFYLAGMVGQRIESYYAYQKNQQ